MWVLDYKESWAPKNWCFWTVVLEKTLESPLDCKETQPAYPKGNQSWIFFGRTDAEAETPILWPPDVENWLIRKTLMLRKIEGRRRRGWHSMRCWMASPTEWTRVWVNPGSWWWTGRPGVLQSMGSQSQMWLSNWTELNGPYTGLSYREDCQPEFTLKQHSNRGNCTILGQEDDIRSRQLAQDPWYDSYDHLWCFLDFLDHCTWIKCFSIIGMFLC